MQRPFVIRVAHEFGEVGHHTPTGIVAVPIPSIRPVGLVAEFQSHFPQQVPAADIEPGMEQRIVKAFQVTVVGADKDGVDDFTYFQDDRIRDDHRVNGLIASLCRRAQRVVDQEILVRVHAHHPFQVQSRTDFFVDLELGNGDQGITREDG